tara:strand:- start:136 stop:1107 length:972 start_codon:yes stop_codon:yes gene_type:complete
MPANVLLIAIAIEYHQENIRVGKMNKKTQKTVLILGGSGFVGRYLTEALSTAGFRIRIPTRNRERVKGAFIVLPNVELLQTNITKLENLDSLIKGVDIVVNCIGILHESEKNDFFKFHEQLVEQIVSSCNRGKVNRFIHISALKCSSSAPSAYLRSKAAGEHMITSKLNTSTAQHILRPSVIFGNGDSFLTMFAELSKWLPFIPLAMPKAKFQPIFIGDLIQLIMRCVNGSEHRQLIEVCGPKQYELIELVNYASTFGRLRPIVLPIPNWAAYLQAMTFEALNLNLITRDNLASMSLDNTTDSTDGAFQTSIESIAPTYLGKK